MAAADKTIDGHEEHELRKIARQLGFSDAQFFEVTQSFPRPEERAPSRLDGDRYTLTGVFASIDW